MKITQSNTYKPALYWFHFVGEQRLLEKQRQVQGTISI